MIAYESQSTAVEYFIAQREQTVVVIIILSDNFPNRQIILNEEFMLTVKQSSPNLNADQWNT